MTIPIKPPSPEESGKPYYLVAVRLKPNKTFTNRPYDWAWLAIDGGYASHSSMVEMAYRFRVIPSLEDIHSYSGRPWYDQHDKRYAPKVYKVYEYFRKDVELVDRYYTTQAAADPR